MSVLKTRTMTVGHLRRRLDDFPDDLPVFTEGCDCWGDAVSVEQGEGYQVEHRVLLDGPYVLIRRADEA